MCEAHQLFLSWMFIILVAYSHLLVSDATEVLNVNTTAGESTVLPCALMRPSIDIKNLRFYWQDENKDVLYSFNKGKEMPEHVKESYHDRVTAFPEDMTRGNISVKVENLTLEDDKRIIEAYAYILRSREERDIKPICQFTLHVAVPYKTVSLDVNEEDKKAVCNVQRGFPEPLVTWRLEHIFNDSKHWLELKDGIRKVVQNAGDHLYNISNTIDISGGPYQNVTCIIHNPTLNVTLTKTHSFNRGEQMRSLPGWVVILIAAAIVLLVTA